jgi:hypothetical protein
MTPDHRNVGVFVEYKCGDYIKQTARHLDKVQGTYDWFGFYYRNVKKYGQVPDSDKKKNTPRMIGAGPARRAPLDKYIYDRMCGTVREP